MKSMRTIFIISGALAVIGIAVPFYLMFWGPDRLELEGKTLPELMESGALLGLLIIPIMLVVVGFSLRSFMPMLFPPKIVNGVKATALVRKVWDTGVTFNENPQVGLLLDVRPPAAPPFQAEVKTVVSRLQVGQIQPGVAAQVEYDPTNPQRIRVLSIDAAGPDAVSRLELLEQMYSKRLITSEEYQQKRSEILKEL